MNVRKAILVLGILATCLVAAIVAIAVLAHRKVELERNQARTANARAARHNRPKVEGGETLPEPEETETKVPLIPETETNGAA